MIAKVEHESKFMRYAVYSKDDTRRSKNTPFKALWWLLKVFRTTCQNQTEYT